MGGKFEVGHKKVGGGSRKGIPNQSRDEVVEAIEKHIPLDELLTLLAGLARGVTVEEAKEGKTIVYTKPPSEKALQTLMDYRCGKPPQRMIHEGSDENPLLIRLDTVCPK